MQKVNSVNSMHNQNFLKNWMVVVVMNENHAEMWMDSQGGLDIVIIYMSKNYCGFRI